MKSNKSLIQWPPILVGRSATVMSLIDTLRCTEILDVTDLRNLQNLQLETIINHHYSNTPLFKERLEQNNITNKDLKTVDDLQKLLPISKSYIQAAGDRFVCDKIPTDHQPIGKVNTSGSTGQPVSLYKTDINQLFWEAHTIRDHDWNNRDYSGRLAAIRATVTGYQTAPNWGVPVGALYDTGPAMGINVSESIDFHFEKLTEFQPDVLIVHAGVLAALATLWERNGYNLHLKHIKNIGDTCTLELRDRIKNLTNLDIEDNYSSSECGTIAIQCSVGKMFHVMAENLIVEILDEHNAPCVPGEIGRVVITDLHNCAAPLIRYDLGDYAEVGTGCSCGRTLPTLKQVIGRERNLFIRPDGSKFWPRAGMYEIPKIVPVKQWQLIQHTIDHVEYRLVVDRHISEDEKKSISKILCEALAFEPKITITQFNDAIPTKNGKYEESICLINQP